MSAPGPDRDRVLRYLGELREETMLLAWGAASDEERRRIVLAALIFGRQFEERAAQRPAESDEDGLRRFLMRLMNGGSRSSPRARVYTGTRRPRS